MTAFHPDQYNPTLSGRLRYLESLLVLPDHWDNTEDSRAITAAAITAASAALTTLNDEYPQALPYAQPAPTRQGGVQLTNRVYNRGLRMEWSPTAEALLTLLLFAPGLRSRHDPFSYSVRRAIGPLPLADAFRWLLGELTYGDESAR